MATSLEGQKRPLSDAGVAPPTHVLQSAHHPSFRSLPTSAVNLIGTNSFSFFTVGAQVEDRAEDYGDLGQFGWATDPEGNRFEIWEPKAPGQE